MPPRELPARVLTRIPNWLGDALMARPFLHALRRTFADARVTATGPAALLSLLASEGLWDEAVAWPPDPGARARLRGARADVAFVLPPSFSSAWWAFGTGARRRVGFTGDARAFLLTDPVRRPPRGDLHLSSEYLQLGAPWGMSGTGALPALPLDAEARRGAGELRARAGGDGPYAILAPGAAYGPAKRWSIARYAELSRRLAARGWTILLCGAASDRDACDAVASHGTGTVLAGASGLGAMAALAAGAQVVVSNDSGLAHLAAAVGAPTVVIFGSTSSAWTAPLGPRVTVVQDAPVCSPCFQRTCRIGYVCLEAVSVAQVTSACDRWVA